MGRPASNSKRENEKKKQSKRLEKQKRKEERKENSNKGATLEEMFAYVDENGMITTTPPEPKAKKEKINIEEILISTPKKEEADGPVIYKGRVEHFNDSKGYGFIKDLESIKKFFFHISSAPAGIKEGNLVSFELERGVRDYNAVNIHFEDQKSSPL